jgi:peroxiredoxin
MFSTTRPLSTPAWSRRQALQALAGLAGTTPLCGLAANPGNAAPDFTLKGLDGRNLRLAEQRGQVVLLNFWASWCGPCKVEMPHLNRLHDKYRSVGFMVLGINVDDDLRTAGSAAQKLAVRFPVLHDGEKAVSRLYALDSMPATVLIDRDGRVRHRHRGYRDGMESAYEQQLRELVKE